MNVQEIEKQFDRQRDMTYTLLRQRLSTLQRMARRHRIKEKLDLIHTEMSKTKYIINFAKHLEENHFDRHFLHLMFESYNPTIDYRKMSKQITRFIMSIRSKCQISLPKH
ncbi:MAG: hypothetical protein R6U52_01450 [Kosmotogaceae bacterium]